MVCAWHLAPLLMLPPHAPLRATSVRDAIKVYLWVPSFSFSNRTYTWGKRPRLSAHGCVSSKCCRSDVTVQPTIVESLPSNAMCAVFHQKSELCVRPLCRDGSNAP